MSDQPPSRPEILKLARLLRCEPERLAYLDQVSDSDLQELREQATDMLFNAHDGTLGRLAAAAKLLPVGLVALIAERAFGPVLAARMAGYLEPSRAIDVASRLPTTFLAEVATDIDPRRTAEVISGIPSERIAELTRILADRGEFVPMGSAVAQLPKESLEAAVSVLSDEELLRTAFVMEDKERLPELAQMFGRDRTIGMIDVAEQAGLEYEAVDLLSHLDESQRDEVLKVLRERDEESHQQVIEQLARIRS